MQNLTGPPRDGLTAEQVTGLLTGSAVEVGYGVELLAPDLSVVEDISEDCSGGQVAWSLNATIHRTCTLALSRELAWGVALVRPWMSLSRGGVSAMWRNGVFALVTPETETGETPQSWTAQGFDRIMLLNRQVGADYVVLAGVTYRAALLAVFAAAGLTGVLIEGAAADDVLPVEKTWLLVGKSTDPDQTTSVVTYLRIVNDLLMAINFRGVWCDHDGLFRCSAYRDPASRPVEWVFDKDLGTTILGDRSKVTKDVWAQPNRWVFRWTNAPEGTVVGDLTYEVNLDAGDPLSAVNRGLTWTSVVDYEAASRAKLIELGDRKVASDMRTTTRIEATTGPFPGAGHADCYQVEGVGRVQATSWQMDLTGGDVQWSFEVVT